MPSKSPAKASHSSSGSFFSSIAMSFNSLDSKTSPHSWHSTYSDSSSRETICTRGCLHCSRLTLFGGDCDGWLDIITCRLFTLERKCAFCSELAIFCGGEMKDVKCFLGACLVSSMPGWCVGSQVGRDSASGNGIQFPHRQTSPYPKGISAALPPHAGLKA